MVLAQKLLRVVTIICFVQLFSTFAVSATYATDQQDLSVGLATLPLMENKITGSATAAIIYDGNNPISKADADSIKSAIDAGLTAPGGVTIKAIMVPITNLGRLDEAKIAFIAQGSASAFTAIAAAASSAGVLTITTDLSCIKAAKCILGVVSTPNVEIYYSKIAGDAAKIGFSQAFTMLVKQI